MLVASFLMLFLIKANGMDADTVRFSICASFVPGCGMVNFNAGYVAKNEVSEFQRREYEDALACFLKSDEERLFYANLTPIIIESVVK